jgi:hypothetical protein
MRWHDVSPPVDGGSAYFLNSDTAWVEADAVTPPAQVPIYRTVDGGASWQKLGSVPNTCDQLDFVDARHGWCASIGGALGSSFVKLYETTDGGFTWTLASETGQLGVAPSTPDSLPFGCDKSITFTSPTVGWASSYCNGGSAFLYTTEDAGSRWYPLSTVTLDSHRGLQRARKVPLREAVRLDAGRSCRAGLQGSSCCSTTTGASRTASLPGC